MKKLLNLEGAKLLNKTEQKAVNGGLFHCGGDCVCPPGYICIGKTCYPGVV